VCVHLNLSKPLIVLGGMCRSGLRVSTLISFTRYSTLSIPFIIIKTQSLHVCVYVCMCVRVCVCVSW